MPPEPKDAPLPASVPQITLENIANGAARELFHAEMQKVLENILDVNTKATATRTITLTFSIQPTSDERDTIDIYIKSASKIVATKPVDTRVAFAKRAGQIIAKELTRPQIPLPGESISQFPRDAGPAPTPPTRP